MAMEDAAAESPDASAESLGANLGSLGVRGVAQTDAVPWGPFVRMFGSCDVEGRRSRNTWFRSEDTPA